MTLGNLTSIMNHEECNNTNSWPMLYCGDEQTSTHDDDYIHTSSIYSQRSSNSSSESLQILVSAEDEDERISRKYTCSTKEISLNEKIVLSSSIEEKVQSLSISHPPLSNLHPQLDIGYSINQSNLPDISSPDDIFIYKPEFECENDFLSCKDICPKATKNSSSLFIQHDSTNGHAKNSSTLSNQWTEWKKIAIGTFLKATEHYQKSPLKNNSHPQPKNTKEKDMKDHWRHSFVEKEKSELLNSCTSAIM
ncbi:hypothetical protein BDF14DRAFT_917111 [Spinellus fusiger]|nr:hypothetical protein BDF14DRAFT_917111 [Spinellus fusiger]